jgi:hypothetical protein
MPPAVNPSIPVVRSMVAATRPNIEIQSRLLTAMMAKRCSVNGPALSHSRMTISVDAGAVAVAIAPSKIAIGQAALDTRRHW